MRKPQKTSPCYFCEGFGYLVITKSEIPPRCCPYCRGNGLKPKIEPIRFLEIPNLET